MSDKKFENIFNSRLPQGFSVNSLKDQNTKLLTARMQESLQKMQLIQDKKIDFKKSDAPDKVAEILAESLSMLYQKQNELEQMRLQLNEKNNQLKQIQIDFKTLQKEKDDLKNLLNDNEQKFHEVFKLKSEEIESLKDQLNKEQTAKQKSLDDSICYNNQYDIIIDIKSLLNIKKEPVKIQYPQNKRISKMDIYQMEQCSVVGIQGLKNKGKTFLLNELNNENFPSGFHYSTSGISVKIDNTDPNNVKVYLDSEGINRPARYDWGNDPDFQNYIKMKKENDPIFSNSNEAQLMKNYQSRVIEKFQDIKSTEQIQQQFLLEHSETILVVVGIISLEEQKIISVISEVCDKDIIVVHNLKEYSKIQHVQDEIDKNLKDFFPLDTQGIDLYGRRATETEQFGCVYQDQRNDKVYHCILAKKGSPAGDYYNQFAYDFIKQKIQLNQVKKSLNITEDFCYFLNGSIRDFVEIKYASEEKRSQKIQPGEVLSSTEGDEFDEITLQPEYEISTTKDILLDVFGKIRNMVNYSIYQQGNIKTVEIELPGDTTLSKASLIKEDEYQILVLHAFKKTQWQEQQGIQELFNNRNLGQITHKIKIGKTTENLKCTKPFKCAKGVYTCEYEITRPDVQLQLESNDEL